MPFLVLGIGLIVIGIPPTAEEFMRIILFTILSIIYVAVWLFFTIFYPLIVNLIAKVLEPSKLASARQVFLYEKLKFGLKQLMPNELFSEATNTLLMPSVRSLGPLTLEQVQGTIPGPLPLGQSVLLIWAPITGLIAATVLCFVFFYISFMKREIRSR